MPVTLPACNGVDFSYHNSPDECPTFRGCLIGDGDRLSPFVPEQFCCPIAWWNCRYGTNGGYYTTWSLWNNDAFMRTYYTLEEACTA